MHDNKSLNNSLFVIAMSLILIGAMIGKIIPLKVSYIIGAAVASIPFAIFHYIKVRRSIK